MRRIILLLPLVLTACGCPWSGQRCGPEGRLPPPPGDLADHRPVVSAPSARPHIMEARDRLLDELRAALAAVVEAQQHVRARDGSYTDDVQRLREDFAADISLHVILSVESASDSTWAGSAVHASLRTHSCVVSIGPERSAPRIHTLRQRLGGHLAPGIITCDTP